MNPTESPRADQPCTSRRPTRSSARKVVYKEPSSDEEGILEEELSPVTKGYLCTSADPRKAGRAEGGEPLILTVAEVKTLLVNQTAMGDQRIWLTTAQMGFPTTPLEDEVSEPKDLQLGRPTARRLHPEISEFICRLQEEISNSNRPLSPKENVLIEMERVWGTRDLGNDEPMMEDSDEETQMDTSWEPNPPPLMASHPPRVTASNTKIHLTEGALSQPCPKGEDNLGWVQTQQKSLVWQEMIDNFSIITHKGLTTLAHSSQLGWTINSGTWNHLRETWGPNPATLTKIQTSCRSQEGLEASKIFTTTRQILLALKETWKLNNIHGLPAVAAPAFFESASKGKDCWWGTPQQNTIFAWDSMDEQDRSDSLAILQNTEQWVVWKTKDKEWSRTLKNEGFHQILSFNKEEKEDFSGFKIKGWWRRGDIKVTKQKSTFECWVKSPTSVPKEVQGTIRTALTTPQRNYGKDSYILDLDGPERTY